MGLVALDRQTLAEPAASCILLHYKHSHQYKGIREEEEARSGDIQTCRQLCTPNEG